MSTEQEGNVVYTKESKILAIIPKVPAFLSIIGSSYIIYNVLFIQRKKNKRDQRNKLYHQLMLALSISDILASHAYFLGTFMIPRGSGGPFGPVYWAFGNKGTCSYSGFFNQFAVASPIYNTMLSIYFLLKIRHNWKDMQLLKIGPFLHAVPILFASGTAFFALLRQPDTLYGNVFWTCWINPDPPQPDFRWFQWAFLFAPVWICVIFQTIAMGILYMSVRKVEKETKAIEEAAHNESESTTRMSRRNTADESSWSVEEESKNEEEDTGNEEEEKDENNHNNNNNNSCRSARTSASGDVEQSYNAAEILAARAKKQKHSRTIAIQGILYVAAFYITWLFPTIQRIMELAGAPGQFWLQALDTTLLPLQGLFNVLIYLRPKYVFFRRKYPDLPWTSVLVMVHNKENEDSIVHKYTTRLNEQLSRIRHSAMNMESGTSTAETRGANRSREGLPPIKEVVSGSSSLMHSKRSNNGSSQEIEQGRSVSLKEGSSSERNSLHEEKGTRAALLDWLQEEQAHREEQQQQQQQYPAITAIRMDGSIMDGSIYDYPE